MTQFTSARKLGFVLFATIAAIGAVAAPATSSSAPVPSKVVSPQALPAWSENSTVKVALTIDASGVPHDVAVAEWTPSDLSHPLVAAVKQWRFTPARRDGKPVDSRVILPIELTRSSDKVATRIAARGHRS